MFRCGDFVTLNGALAIVVATDGEEVADLEGPTIVPEEHVALWFGGPSAASREGEAASPEVWTVPMAYCRPAPLPVYRH
jgi:hypothetical protein